MKYLAMQICDFFIFPTGNNFFLFYKDMTGIKGNIFKKAYYCCLLPFFVLRYTKTAVITWES
jgi:hypothetical protein